MNHLHSQKDHQQLASRANEGKTYEVAEREKIANHSSLVGLRYVAESKRGKVIKSSWLEHVDEDGTVYKLNTRIRIYTTPAGNDIVKKDHTLIVCNVGGLTKKEVSENGTHLLRTSIGVVCMTCLTSDHIVLDKDGTGCTCTRCGSWLSAKAQREA